jgi:hypothetical protein
MTKIKDWCILAIPAASLALMLFYHETITGLVATDVIDLSNLYNAVFGWSSIQTGFLFAVYGFVTGKRDGFVGAIAQTNAMKFFNNSLGKAIIVGFTLTLVSMPLIAMPIAPTDLDVWYVLVSLWFSFFLWSFLLFCKVAYNFGIISMVADRNDRPAH